MGENGRGKVVHLDILLPRALDPPSESSRYSHRRLSTDLFENTKGTESLRYALCPQRDVSILEVIALG